MTAAAGPRLRRARESHLRCVRGTAVQQDPKNTPDVVAELGRRTVWWATDREWLVRQAIDAVGAKSMRDIHLGLLCSPITMASDVIAMLEYRHHLTVQTLEVDR